MVINRKWSAEAIQWLERGGRSVRLPPLPEFPNRQEEREEPNQDQLMLEPEYFDGQEEQEEQNQDQMMVETGDNQLQTNALNGASIQTLEQLQQPFEHAELPAVPKSSNQLAVETTEAANNQCQNSEADNHSLEILQQMLERAEGPAISLSPQSPESPESSNQLLVETTEAGEGNHESLQQNASNICGKRRFSTAGGILFSVNENVRETGSDFLTKIVRESNIIAPPVQSAQPDQPEIRNDFDPFKRLENPPFSLRGRQRSASQDGYFRKYEPTLQSIQE